MTLEVERIEALLFDVDGTLRDTDDQYVRRLSGWLTRVRFLFGKRDLDAISRRIIMGLESPVHIFYSALDWLTIDDEIVTLGNWIQDLSIFKSQSIFMIIPEIAESLGQLGERYPMAVVSARGERGTLEFLDHYELRGKFDCIASGQTAPRTKPWPDPVFWAAKQLKVSPKNCLMIGDTTVDIRAGRAAGAQTVGVLTGFGRAEELDRAGADLILDSAAELPEILL